MLTENKYAGLYKPENAQAGSVSFPAARVAIIFSSACLILVALLHFLKPDYAPTWHFVSEYAIGEFGWVMKIAFMCWAISCFALCAAVKPQINTLAGKIGLVLLVIVGISMITGGIFVMDPLTASKDELTTHGNLHALSGMVGIPGKPIAALLISYSLVRHPSWRPVKRSILWSAHFTWISLVLMMGYLGIKMGETGGQFGPEVVVGLFNRLLVIAYCLWVMVVAKRAMRR